MVRLKPGSQRTQICVGGGSVLAFYNSVCFVCGVLAAEDRPEDAGEGVKHREARDKIKVEHSFSKLSGKCSGIAHRKAVKRQVSDPADEQQDGQPPVVERVDSEPMIMF